MRFFKYYEYLLHKIDLKISKDSREYWSSEAASLRANLPKIKIILKKEKNFLP